MSARLEAAERLVIGGGPAGSMAALRLREAGYRVTLIEKERVAHHKVCGEFLSHEAVEYLQRAGLSPFHLGAATIHFVRLSSGNRCAEAELPFRALSLSRYVLDAALLEHAAAHDCHVIRGVSVDRLATDGGAWQAQLNDGRSLHADTVFLATGKHDLHGWSRDRGVQGDLIGLKGHWRLAAAQTRELREWMELFLFPGGYGGISLVEEETANLCFVVRRAELRGAHTAQELLMTVIQENRRLRHLLEGAQCLWGKPLAISPIPYGHLVDPPGSVWRIGDQAAVIPSFTGDGMSIALHSAQLAAQMYAAGKTAEEYHHILRAQLSQSVQLATWLSRAMVTAAGRNLALLATSLFPSAMRWIATSTRIPARDLLLDEAH